MFLKVVIHLSDPVNTGLLLNIGNIASPGQRFFFDSGYAIHDSLQLRSKGNHMSCASISLMNCVYVWT